MQQCCRLANTLPPLIDALLDFQIHLYITAVMPVVTHSIECNSKAYPDNCKVKRILKALLTAQKTGIKA